jgi:predicted AAA+ superfamily ATPase
MSQPLAGYRRRIVDDELGELLPEVSAVAIEGAKAIGKTVTAARRAATIHRLDDPSARSIALAEPRRMLEGPHPVLIDEWQRVPESWDLVRRAVDHRAPNGPGSYLLTGSASPLNPPTHSGAARIVRIRMRTLTLPERGISTPTVSLRDLLNGTRPSLEGSTDVGLEGYVDEILASGFPGLRGLSGRALRSQLDGYVARIVDHDFDDIGHRVRRPQTLLGWMRAYAAASSTVASYEKIRDAATSGEVERPTRKATVPYRTILEKLWVVDPVPAWLPTRNRLRRLSSPPKHQLVDPALAVRLLGVDKGALLDARPVGPPIPRDGTLLGSLFESLVTLNVRVFAQAAEASTRHLRTAAGEHEVDLIVERNDGRIVALEVKLARIVDDDDLRDLLWLRDRIGPDLLDAVVVTTGDVAYRRPDGIGVVPAALLGP